MIVYAHTYAHTREDVPVRDRPIRDRPSQGGPNRSGASGRVKGVGADPVGHERAGRDRPGRDKPSVYEVARRAGVSTATVSRVLAGYERVLPGTRDKVLTAVSELGYVPSGAARDLAARRTGVLGLCFPDLTGDQDTEQGDAAYWYDEVIRGMERAARRSGYAVLIAASHHRDDGGLVLSIAGRCDGLVVLARTALLAMIEHVAARIPVVLLATRGGPDGGSAGRAIDYLTVANETGAYQVTSHLTGAHGYTDVCFIAGPPDSPDSASRHDGFRRATAGSAASRPTCPPTTATSPPPAGAGSPSGSSPAGGCRGPWCAPTTRRRSGPWRRWRARA
jgi:LacI family transcriptional regulator